MQKDNPINKMKDIYLLSKQTNKQILNIIKIKNKNYEKKIIITYKKIILKWTILKFQRIIINHQK